MEKDEVDVTVQWVPDAIHDVFITPDGWWDEDVREHAWREVETWVQGFVK
jgi:hypothetical protein